MANQYAGSFEHKIQQRFGLTAEVFLRQCETEGLSYMEIEKKTGFNRTTIKKWAKRYDVCFEMGAIECEATELSRLFSKPEINPINFLSRSWLNPAALEKSQDTAANKKSLAVKNGSQEKMNKSSKNKNKITPVSSSFEIGDLNMSELDLLEEQSVNAVKLVHWLLPSNRVDVHPRMRHQRVM